MCSMRHKPQAAQLCHCGPAARGHDARMKSSFLLLPVLWVLTLAAAGQGRPGEPPGQWQPAPKDGRPWRHEGTRLTFPPQLGGYRLAGEFKYENGGAFIRYENLDERSRADIFFFKTSGPVPAIKDQQRLILTEMDNVVADMEAMVRQGRYKNLDKGEVVGGELELWMKQSLPIATRYLTTTRLGIAREGTVEAVVKVWIGITVYEGHVITIRHMRPADNGDAGEESMKGFVGVIFQLIKDPSLRGHLLEMLDAYMKNPLSDDGEQAAAAVLAYLNQAPWLPISIPEEPVSRWLEHFAEKSPGTQDHLLRAFMLGSAKAAFQDGDALACLEAGARQFAVIYRQLSSKFPQITLPEADSFAAAAEKGLGAAWLKDHSYLTQ